MDKSITSILLPQPWHTVNSRVRGRNSKCNPYLSPTLWNHRLQRPGAKPLESTGRLHWGADQPGKVWAPEFPQRFPLTCQDWQAWKQVGHCPKCWSSRLYWRLHLPENGVEKRVNDTVATVSLRKVKWSCAFLGAIYAVLQWHLKWNNLQKAFGGLPPLFPGPQEEMENQGDLLDVAQRQKK